MNFNFYMSSTLIGLDINPTGIWFIQLKKHKRNFIIERAITLRLSHEIFVDGKIEQWNTLTEILLELIKKVDLKYKSTAIQLASSLVKRERISLPIGMSSAQVKAEINAQAEQNFPELHDELCIDFTEIEQKTTGYNDVYFAVTPQEYLSQYVDCIQNTGLKVKLVDIDIYALKRAYQYVVGQEVLGNKNTAIIYERHSWVTLLIYNQLDIVFAERWKVDFGEDFVSQLRSQLQLYLSTFNTIKIQQIIIGGANAEYCLKAKELAESFAFPVFYPNPAAKFKIDKNIHNEFYCSKASEFMIACGLAMRNIPKW